MRAAKTPIATASHKTQQTGADHAIDAAHRQHDGEQIGAGMGERVAADERGGGARQLRDAGRVTDGRFLRQRWDTSGTLLLDVYGVMALPRETGQRQRQMVWRRFKTAACGAAGSGGGFDDRRWIGQRGAALATGPAVMTAKERR